MRLHKISELRDRLPPAQIAGVRRNHVRDALLHDLDFGADRNRPQRHGHLHLAGQVRVVEAVGVDELLIGHEFEVFAAEAVRVTGREVGERHAVAAADAGVDFVDLAGEAVGRQPAGHRIGVEEGLVDLLGRGLEDEVQADGVGHRASPFLQ